MLNHQKSYQEIRGIISDSGISRGKTLAAWHGVPTQHTFIVVSLDADVDRPPAHKEDVYVWSSDHTFDQIDPLIGRRVRLNGHWRLPPEPQVDEIYEIQQQPIRLCEIITPVDVQIDLAEDCDETELIFKDLMEPQTPIHLAEIQAPYTLIPERSGEEIDSSAWVPVTREAHFQSIALQLIEDESPCVTRSLSPIE